MDMMFLLLLLIHKMIQIGQNPAFWGKNPNAVQ